jgi:glycosyltransferase involved in cell wall biosynthesis
MSCGIGAIVITRNEESQIVDCLRSVAFCDERIVVDSFSTDDTVRRASDHAEHVYRRTFIHHADQKNWAMEQLRCSWALILDADERVSPALAEELIRRAEGGDADAYWLERRNDFFGRPMHSAGWGRDRVIRFLRRDAGRYRSQYLHEEIQLEPGRRVGFCRNPLLHYSYRDWDSTFERFLRYSSRGALDRQRRGLRGHPWRVAGKPLGRFLRQYLLQGAWREGIHGYVLCAWSAAGVFVREAKLVLGEIEAPVLGGGHRGAIRVETVRGRKVRSAGDEERT